MRFTQDLIILQLVASAKGEFVTFVKSYLVYLDISLKGAQKC